MFKTKNTLSSETYKSLLELERELRDRYQEDIDFDDFLKETISYQTQVLKDQYPTKEEIKERNQKRLEDLKNNEVYCPQRHGKIKNLMACHISCQFGHMTECHYPFTCDSDYCKHYKIQEEITNVNRGE